MNKKEVELGDSVKADLKLYFQQSKDFQVKWPEKNLIKLIDWNEALFAVDDYGDFDFSPTVTRISDGYSKKIPCSVYIECDQYECLSLAGKRLYKVRQILEEVSSWNNGEYSNLTSSDKCNIAESIIRAYEYEYGLIGGTQLPVFSKGLDCASNVSIAAYEYKLKVLEQTLPVE